MTEPDLTPQEPGDLPSVDNDRIQAIADGNVGDLAEALDALDDTELEQLHAAELRGKARSTALGAIVREQERRQVEAEHPPTGDPGAAAPAPVGDDVSYAHMRAAEIDPRGLERPVLSRDGWVLPLPSARPE